MCAVRYLSACNDLLGHKDLPGLCSQTSACTESCLKIMQGLYQSANSQHFNPCHRHNNNGLCAECAAEKGLPQQVPQRWLAGSIPAPSQPPGEQLQPH